MTIHKLNRSAIAIVIVSLTLQAITLWQTHRHDPTAAMPVIDDGVYHQAAVRFAQRQSLEDDAFWQPPLLPPLLGCLYRVTGANVLIARICLADALVEQKAYAEAIERYRQALWRVEPDPALLNRAAWLLAACEQVELRDCERAIEIAEHPARITRYDHAAALDTPRGCVCRMWSLERSRRVGETSRQLARSQLDDRSAGMIPRRLEQYESRRNQAR